MKVFRFLFVSFAVALLTLGVASYAHSNPTTTSTQSVHWSYNGEVDPSHWGDLNAEFAVCKTGKQQSPVDIQTSQQVDLPSIQFSYKDTAFKVINNGHAIEVEYEPGSSITIDGNRYELNQFHFHAPSEHTVNGKAYPLEAHLVHKSKDGKIAVVGVFMEEGKPNDFIETLWAHLPKQEQEKIVSGVKINASALPPNNKSYYHYFGSLTTPPCTEGVNWNILKTPIQVSQEQIEKFTTVYRGNARPVQPLNQRVIEGKNF